MIDSNKQQSNDVVCVLVVRKLRSLNFKVNNVNDLNIVNRPSSYEVWIISALKCKLIDIPHSVSCYCVLSRRFAFVLNIFIHRLSGMCGCVCV